MKLRNSTLMGAMAMLALGLPGGAQAGKGTCTAGPGATVDGGSCCTALGATGCTCDESDASVNGVVTCTHDSIANGEQVVVTQQTVPGLMLRPGGGGDDYVARRAHTLFPRFSRLVHQSQSRRDQIQIVRENVDPEQIGACLGTPDNGNGNPSDHFVGNGGPSYSPLECEPISFESGGSMQFAMRCLLESDLDASDPVDIEVRLRVSTGGGDYWSSCYLDFDIAPSEEDPADAAQVIADRINSTCDQIAAGHADLGNGSALVDVWSTESPLICVEGVGGFQNCGGMSSMWIAN